jgi:hypothetical protein
MNLEKVKVKRYSNDQFWIYIKNEDAKHFCYYHNFHFKYHEPQSIRKARIYISPFDFHFRWESGAREPQITNFLLPIPKEEKEFILKNWRYVSRNSIYSIPKLFAYFFKEILYYFTLDTKKWCWNELIKLILEDEYYDEYERNYKKTKFYNSELDNTRKERLFEAIKYNFALATLFKEYQIKEKLKKHICEECGKWLNKFYWKEDEIKRLKLVCKKCYEEKMKAVNEELLNACEKGDLEKVKLLLKEGADINTKNKYGWTPLMIACEKDNKEMVKLLLEKGADVKAKNINGKSALVIAYYYGHQEIVKLLKSYGAKE